MKPYVSEIYELNGKTCMLPIPAKYRELLDLAHALGIEDYTGENDLKVVGYKTLLVPMPGAEIPRIVIERTATALSKLSDAQVRAMSELCDAFGLTFKDILPVLGLINYCLREESEHED